MHPPLWRIAIIVAFALGGGIAGCGTTPTVPGGAAGMTSEQVDTLPGNEPYTIRTSVYHVSAPAGNTAMYTVTITNRTDENDIYTLQPSSTHGWTDFSGLPATVALDGKANATFSFTVTIPATARLGTIERAAIESRSRARPYLHFGDATVTEVVKQGLVPSTILEAVLSAPEERDFDGKSAIRALRGQIDPIKENLRIGNTERALAQLEQDLLPHLDGCATSNTPDANDWIVTCAGQTKVYAKIQELVAALKAE